MEEKAQVKRWLLMGTIIFVVLVAIEWIAVRIVDSNMEKESFALNTLEKVVNNEYEEDGDTAENDSQIVGRKLTADERKQQDIRKRKHSLMLYNNIGLAEDIFLPDGSWLLAENQMIIRITDRGLKDSSPVYFILENQELLNRYRSYWEDNHYSYDKNLGEMVERYRYYQLVFDRFYLDDMTIIPQTVSIYKVERMPENDAEYPEITACTLMETIQLETTGVTGMDCYELATAIDADTVANLSYDYTCNGTGEYKIMKDCTLNGKYYSLEERKLLLTDCLQKTYETRDRDLIGFSNYYYRNTKHYSELLGGDVTAVGCESNIYYNTYRYAWLLAVVVLGSDLMLAIFITGIAFLVKRNKKNKVG